MSISRDVGIWPLMAAFLFSCHSEFGVLLLASSGLGNFLDCETVPWDRDGRRFADCEMWLHHEGSPAQMPRVFPPSE